MLHDSNPTAPIDLFGTAPHDPGGKAKPKWPAGSVITARFSPCGLYRYELGETWDTSRKMVMWLIMNPSMASAAFADPTLTKTGRFSRAWGYGGQIIGNIHAYRVTASRRLTEVADPVGPENDAALLAMAARADIVILAYGQPPKALRPRGAVVVDALRGAGAALKFLRLANDGTPWHPLYLPSDIHPQDYP